MIHPPETAIFMDHKREQLPEVALRRGGGGYSNHRITRKAKAKRRAKNRASRKARKRNR